MPDVRSGSIRTPVVAFDHKSCPVQLKQLIIAGMPSAVFKTLPNSLLAICSFLALAADSPNSVAARIFFGAPKAKVSAL